MTDSPVVIIKKSSSSVEKEREFAFSPDLNGLSGSILEYYQNAWKVFQTIKFPTLKEEAWRRTDIHGLAVESFRIGGIDEQKPVPAELLEPMTDSHHGGQIIFTETEAQVSLERN